MFISFACLLACLNHQCYWRKLQLNGIKWLPQSSAPNTMWRSNWLDWNIRFFLLNVLEIKKTNSSKKLILLLVTELWLTILHCVIIVFLFILSFWFIYNWNFWMISQTFCTAIKLYWIDNGQMSTHHFRIHNELYEFLAQPFLIGTVNDSLQNRYSSLESTLPSSQSFRCSFDSTQLEATCIHTLIHKQHYQI